MLQFIYGLPLSGKTTHIINKVKELSSIGKKTVIIVPEQSSFETEKAVFKSLGDSFTLNVEVLSFSRLYDEVCRKSGGTAARNLNDSDKIIFMNKTLRQISNELKLWKKYTNSLSFAQKMLDAVGELKINGISSIELRNAAKLIESENLKNKLNDLSLIYDTYDLLTCEKFIDPTDKLTRLYKKLENINYFTDKAIFFDGFKGFTGQQYKIIDRIFSQTDNVCFAFTNNSLKCKEYDIFSNIRTAVSKIENIAKNHNINIQAPLLLDKCYYNSKTLGFVEKLLSEKVTEGDCFDSVSVCKAKTIYDEADFVAHTIRRLVRNEGYRFKDFAIITRDSEKYHQAFEYACRKNRVDCFFDKKISLLSFPLSVAVLSAIKSLDYSTENIFRFHKSGINLLSVEEISKIENYCHIWNINGKTWIKNWDMDVRGFVTEEQNQYTETSLEEINLLRQRIIEPINFLKEHFNGNVSQMAIAIIKLIEKYSLAASLKKICENFKEDEYSSDVIKQSYDSFMTVIDSIVTCYNKVNVSVNEFYETLYLALSLEEVGVIPQTLDQAIFGQADRIRPPRPKVVFILGANQGCFPKYCDNSGIFAIKERKNLIELGLNINDNEIFATIDEKFLVYCNTCAASDKLYITYSNSNLKGETLEASAFVTDIENKLRPKIYIWPDNQLSLESLPETFDSAFSKLCTSFNSDESFYTLKQALENTGKDKVASLISGISNENKTLSKDKAVALYTPEIHLSASKIDLFHRCKFSHFCKYGLRLKKLQPADFDVLQRGTIVHYVLEKIICEYKESIKELLNFELDKLCDKYINEYLDSVKGYRSVQNAKHEFLISKISRSLKEVLYHLRDEFLQSDFKPIHCELEIGDNNGINLNFPFENGTIYLDGKIDRVDSYNGYLRVVDYKTGAKSFKLPDILFGLNLQMLIYLYAITRGQNLPDNTAAGIFYMHSKRDLDNEGMAMDGLAQGDIELVRAMDKENEGRFVPKLKINKDGSMSKSASSYVSVQEFTEIFDHIERLMVKTGNSILNGEIEISPIDGRESAACSYCDYKAICCIEDKPIFKVPALKNSEVFEIIAKEKEDGV